MSFGKLLLLAAIIALVWVGARMIAQMNRVRADSAARDARRRATRGGRPQPGRVVEAADMVRCPVCDVYVPAGAPPCERSDCPPRR